MSILNYNQDLVLFRQKQILFIQLLNVWLHFTNHNFPAPTSVKEIFDQTHIFKYTVQTDNLYSITTHPETF